MNLEELWRILDGERSSAALQELSSDFYEEASGYIRELEKEREETATDDPKAILLEDELKTARMRIESIFTKRIGKVINLASSKASGLLKDPNGMTALERNLYYDTVKIIEDIKDAILGPILSGARINREILQPSREVGDEEGGDMEEKNHTMEGFTIVRILRDIPTFVGSDGRNYTLGREDVVVLPTSNAEALCVKGAALKVSHSPID
ncbi:MAG: hypothetical protein SVM80_03605 [Halobacteriota archaeon]|nr:hypothetical protein [Halobacteriota archaeon]